MTTQDFVSVPTLIKSRFRMVEGADSPQYCKGLIGLSDVSLAEEMLAHTRLPNAVLRFMVEMDRKLDVILSYMQRDNVLADFPHEGRIVKLSGSGLILECKEALAPGDHMELLLMLEEFPLRMCSVISKVDSPHKGKVVTGPPNSAWNISYACVQEEDREAIIRFVFREERKRIRQQKGE